MESMAYCKIEKKLPLIIKVHVHDNRKITGFIGDTLSLVKYNVRRYYSKSISEFYGVIESSQKTSFYIVFPNIVINRDPIYINFVDELQKIVAESCQKLMPATLSILFDTDELFIDAIQEDYDSKVKFYIAPKTKSDEDDGGEDIEMEYFSESEIADYQKREITENTLFLNIKRYDFLMGVLRSLDNKDEIFKKNILIFASAYVNYHDKNLYSNCEQKYVTKDDWITFAESFSASNADAQTSYFECNDFAYTLLTVEELLKRQSPFLEAKITKFNREFFTHNIKTLLLSDDEITHDDRCDLFAEFIRSNHFYADGYIHYFDGHICAKVEPSYLNPIVKKFKAEVKSIKDLLEIEESDSKESKRSSSRLATRFSKFISDFFSRGADSLVKDSCAKKLNTVIKTGTSKNAVAFRDMCVVYSIIDGEKNLELRKCYMEDHFRGTTMYDLAEFGKREEERRAIEEVKECYRKMFVYQEQVDFFMAWLGSIYVRHPERCGLFMMGKGGENGKTTATNALVESLGIGLYGHQYTGHMFYTNTKGNQTCEPFWAAIEGALIGSVPETNAKSTYSATAFKEATGGDLKNTAAKNKDPRTFKHTAKIVFASNSWIRFDEFDKPVQSRLYPLRCIGEFRADSKTVPEDPEEQDRLHIYKADKDFWTTLRKRAQLHISLTEGFELYKKHGLVRTKYMEQDLIEWRCSVSDYAHFYMKLEFEEGNKRFYSKTSELARRFALQYLRNNAMVDEESFINEYESINGIKHFVHDGAKYFWGRDPRSTNFHYYVDGEIITNPVDLDSCDGLAL